MSDVGGDFRRQLPSMIGMAGMFVATIFLAMYIRPWYDKAGLQAFGEAGSSQLRYIGLELIMIFIFTAAILMLAKYKKEWIIKYGIMGILFIANAVPATDWSPVTDTLFSTVFGSAAIAAFASMMAYLLAQFIDIQIYHYWKRLTGGKHLWLRNNCSTFLSQLVDTSTVLLLLCAFGEIEWDLFVGLLLAGFLFKVFIAALDTPFLYLGVFLFRKRFNLEINQEIELD